MMSGKKALWARTVIVSLSEGYSVYPKRGNLLAVAETYTVARVVYDILLFQELLGSHLGSLEISGVITWAEK